MKNKSLIRVVSALLLVAMLVGFMPISIMDKSYAAEGDFVGVKEVAAGYSHTIFLKNNGTVWATGNNENGQLGLGDTEDRNTPTKVDIDNVKEVVAGSYYTIFIKNDGTVWATGSNGDGQLGLGDRTNRNTPTKVDIDNVKEVVAGHKHTIFIKKDGTVWATGYNSSGQLGLGDTTNRNTPTKVDIDNVKEVAAGGNHTMFLKNDGTVWATGYNTFGQLGLRDDNSRKTPTKVNIDNVKEVAAGREHTIFLKNDGTVWATGKNEQGQLGSWGKTSIKTPTKVDIDNVKEVAAGGYHTMFLKEDGTVWATGDNKHGRLGLGDKTIIKTPTKVDIDNVKEVVAGDSHTIFIKNDGAVWATGNNYYGQLGLGDTKNRNTPTLNKYISFFIIDKIHNLKEVKKYGSWANKYYGYNNDIENYEGFDSNKAEIFGSVIDKDQQRIERILPNGWVLTVDNYGMINWHKEFSSNQPNVISFDGNKVTKIELGHIDGIGLVPFLYTNDGFIHYIDNRDNQVRMLPVFQNEIKGTMVYHEASNKSTHYLFIKNDGSLVYVDKNRLEQSTQINMSDVAQIIPSTHARPDYFLMKDGTLKTLTGDVTLPTGLTVKTILSNRFVELSDEKIYSMQGTSVKSTDILSFMVQGATNDLLALKNGQIMKLDENGNASYLNDVNGKLVKSIVKVDENSSFILMLDNTTKAYGDIANVGDLANKGIDYTKVVGFISNNTGTNMLMMLVDKGNYGQLYDSNGYDYMNLGRIVVTNTVLEDIKEESGFTFDPQAQVESLIATIEQKITNMTKVEEAEEIQNLINKLPFSHQEDKNRLQQMLIDKVKELESGGIAKEAEEAVKKAEETKLQVDIDNARELVNKLPEGEVKNSLNARLDKVQAEINNNEEYKKAQEAVKKAEETKDPEDIKKAEELVDNLPDGPNKDALKEKIKKTKEELDRIISMPNITVVNGKKISGTIRDTQIEGTYNGITFTIEGNNTKYTGTPKDVPTTWTKVETLKKGKIWVRSISAPTTEQQVINFY